MPPGSPSPSTGIKWHEVTWYSKLGAIILFLGIVPVVCFYIGTQYELAQQSFTAPISMSVSPANNQQENVRSQNRNASIATTTPAGIPVTIEISPCAQNDDQYCFGSGTANSATKGNITVFDTVSTDCSINYGVIADRQGTKYFYNVDVDSGNNCSSLQPDDRYLAHAQFRDEILNGALGM